MSSKPDSKKEMDKFRRRLIHAVAHVLRDKRPLSELWPTMKASTLNCEQLWERMRALTLKKLSRLLPAEDKLERLAKPARMTVTDWLMFDLVLVNEPIDLITLESKSGDTTKATPNVLGELFLLVQRFNLEDPKDTTANTAGWAAATLRYNQYNHRQCSPMLLQKRWYQLKLTTRERFYAFWNVYKGKQTFLKKAQEIAPSRLECAIAKKYPHIAVNEFPTWEELMEKGMIVMPDQLAQQIRLPDLPKPRDVNDPDIIIIETEVETIDLGQYSDSEERETMAQNTENLIVDSVQDDINTEQNSDSEKRETMAQNNEITVDCVQDGINTDGPLMEITNVTGNVDIDAMNVTLNNGNTYSAVTIKQENVEIEGQVPPTEEVDLIGEFETDQVDHTDINDSEVLISVEPMNTICDSVQDDNMIEDNREQPKNYRSETAVDTFDDNDLFADQILTDNLEFVDDGIEFVEDDEMVDSDVNQSVSAIDKTEYVLPAINNVKDNLNSESSEIIVEEQVIIKEESPKIAIERPKFDLKLLMYPVVYTKKVDHITVLKNMDKNETICVKDILQEIILESTPVSDKSVNIKNAIEINCSNEKDLNDTEEIKYTDDIIKLSPINTVISETNNEAEYENHPVLISSIENEVLEESPDTEIIPEELRVKPSSRLLQKPRVREYSTVQLCKNPDFNTRLKRLSPSFCLVSRNRQFLKICKPLSIDLHKDFESKLINNTLYLKSAVQTDFKSETEETPKFTSITPTAMPAQSLVDQETIDMKQLMTYSATVTTKPISNPLMEQEMPIVTRINNNNQDTNIYNHTDIKQDVTRVRQINNNPMTTVISPLNTEINDKIQPPVKRTNKPPKHIPVPWSERSLYKNPTDIFNLTHSTLMKMFAILDYKDNKSININHSEEKKVVKGKHKYCCWYKEFNTKVELLGRRRIRPHRCGDVCTCCCNVSNEATEEPNSRQEIKISHPDLSQETELAVAQLQVAPGEKNLESNLTQKSAEIVNNSNRKIYDECIVLSDEEKDTISVKPAKGVKSRRPRNRVRTRIVQKLNNLEMRTNRPVGISTKDNNLGILNTNSLLAQNIVPAFKGLPDSGTHANEASCLNEQNQTNELNSKESLGGNSIQNNPYPSNILMSITVDGKPIDVAVTLDLESQVKNTNTSQDNMGAVINVDEDVSNDGVTTSLGEPTILNVPNETSPSSIREMSLLKGLNLIVTPNRQVLPVLQEGSDRLSEKEIAVVEEIVNSLQSQINTYMDSFDQDGSANSQDIIDKSNTVYSIERSDVPENVHFLKDNTAMNYLGTNGLETITNPLDTANNDNCTELGYGNITNIISEAIINKPPEVHNNSNLLTSECTKNNGFMKNSNADVDIDLIINNDCDNELGNVQQSELNNKIDPIDRSKNVKNSSEPLKGLRLKRFAALSESFGKTNMSPPKKTSILSDLMEMSGISSDDVKSTTDQQTSNPSVNVERRVISIEDTINDTVKKLYPKILPKPCLVVSPLKPENSNQNDHEDHVTVIDVDSDEDTIIVKKSSRRKITYQPKKRTQTCDRVVRPYPSILKNQHRQKTKTILIYQYPEQPNNRQKHRRKEKIEAKIDLVDSDAPIEEEYLVDSFDSDSDTSPIHLIRNKTNNKLSHKTVCVQNDNDSVISDETVNNNINDVNDSIDSDSDVSLSNYVQNTFVKNAHDCIYVKKVNDKSISDDTLNNRRTLNKEVTVQEVSYKIITDSGDKSIGEDTVDNKPTSDEEVSVQTQRDSDTIVSDKRVHDKRKLSELSDSDSSDDENLYKKVTVQKLSAKIITDSGDKSIREDTVDNKPTSDEEASVQTQRDNDKISDKRVHGKRKLSELSDSDSSDDEKLYKKVTVQELSAKIITDSGDKSIGEDTVHNKPTSDEEVSVQTQRDNNKFVRDKRVHDKRKLSELSDSDSSDDEPLAKKVMRKNKTEQTIGNAQEIV